MQIATVNGRYAEAVRAHMFMFSSIVRSLYQ